MSISNDSCREPAQGSFFAAYGISYVCSCVFTLAVLYKIVKSAIVASRDTLLWTTLTTVPLVIVLLSTVVVTSVTLITTDDMHTWLIAQIYLVVNTAFALHFAQMTQQPEEDRLLILP